MDQRPKQVSIEDLDKAPLSEPGAQSPVDADQWREKHNEVADENFSLKEEISSLKQKLNTKNILDDMLKPYALYAYVFMCCYSAFVAAILLMNGFGCFDNPIPESVMQFLVGSTAATVIGLVGMVLTGIFIGARK
ncbi:hypothetical protein [Oricola sp.]|uniref:hypothetical protein n=1 Tax=Oricola sp. TaxID=1979950 RepID=UPI0025D8A64E|nr:hypothetical protein [Oricola sp.]MCI5075252.1 hypothetical protein [Oricola sp.]